MDVLCSARDLLLKFGRVILQASIVELVLERHGRKLRHVALNWGWLRSIIYLLSKLNYGLAVVENCLMRVVRGDIRSGDLGKRGWACDPHKALLSIEGQDLRTNVLNARVDEI